MEGAGARISVDRIESARSVIDPVFLDTPQFRSDGLSDALEMDAIFKIECLNPIRSFKGRGASWFAHRHKDSSPSPWVTASAGNFGQGLAYVTRDHGIPILVYAAETANPLKIDRMKDLGADVRLSGRDFDEAKETARRFAEASAQRGPEGPFPPRAKSEGSARAEEASENAPGICAAGPGGPLSSPSEERGERASRGGERALRKTTCRMRPSQPPTDTSSAPTAPSRRGSLAAGSSSSRRSSESTCTSAR